MSRATRLHTLQEIDSRRDRARAELARIAARLRGDSAVAEARQTAAAAEAAVAELEPRYRSISRDREDVKAHLGREEQKLYGGAVRAPKEVQNLQREVEALRRRLAVLDDSVLELMVARDELRERLTAATDALASTIASAAADTRELRKQQASLAATVLDLDARRRQAAETVPAADLAAYDRLRREKGGLAVARLAGSDCGSCGIQLPRHEADRVLSSHGLIYCSGCGRILAG